MTPSLGSPLSIQKVIQYWLLFPHESLGMQYLHALSFEVFAPPTVNLHGPGPELIAPPTINWMHTHQILNS